MPTRKAICLCYIGALVPWAILDVNLQMQHAASTTHLWKVVASHSPCLQGASTAHPAAEPLAVQRSPYRAA